MGSKDPAISHSQYQKSTHRANSSVHSRDGGAAAAIATSAAGGALHPFRTPDIKQSSTVSVMLGQHQPVTTGMRAGDFHSLSSFAGNNNLNLQVPLQTMQAKMSGKKDFQALK